MGARPASEGRCVMALSNLAGWTGDACVDGAVSATSCGTACGAGES